MTPDSRVSASAAAQRRQRPPLWLIAALLIASVLTFFGYYVKLQFSESEYMEPGSLKYYLLIRSPFIKGVPVVKPRGGLTYHWTCGDGPKLAGESVLYVSTAHEGIILAKMRAYFKVHGARLSRAEPESGEWWYDTGTHFVHLRLIARGNGIRVAVAELGPIQ